MVLGGAWAVLCAGFSPADRKQPRRGPLSSASKLALQPRDLLYKGGRDEGGIDDHGGGKARGSSLKGAPQARAHARHRGSLVARSPSTRDSARSLWPDWPALRPAPWHLQWGPHQGEAGDPQAMTSVLVHISPSRRIFGLSRARDPRENAWTLDRSPIHLITPQSSFAAGTVTRCKIYQDGG